jgi:hypothetical protein
MEFAPLKRGLPGVKRRLAAGARERLVTIHRRMAVQLGQSPVVYLRRRDDILRTSVGIATVRSPAFPCGTSD